MPLKSILSFLINSSSSQLPWKKYVRAAITLLLTVMTIWILIVVGLLYGTYRLISSGNDTYKNQLESLESTQQQQQQQIENLTKQLENLKSQQLPSAQ